MTAVFPKKYETLNPQIIDGNILHLELNRQKALNAMNIKFFQEFRQFFKDLKEVSDIRVVILSGSGKHFSAGLDLKEAMSLFDFSDKKDQARNGIEMVRQIKMMQNAFISIQSCDVPVIAAIHGYCIGGAIDLICHCDIRISEQSTQFCIKEIDIGMAADLGTLQVLPYIVGNNSFIREVAFTGRYFSSEEAQKNGLISGIYKNKEELMQKTIELAKKIAEKTPVGIFGIKRAFNFSRIYKIKETLDYMRTMNSNNLFTQDMSTAIKASLMKEKAVFPKL